MKNLKAMSVEEILTKYNFSPKFIQDFSEWCSTQKDDPIADNTYGLTLQQQPASIPWHLPTGSIITATAEDISDGD